MRFVSYIKCPTSIPNITHSTHGVGPDGSKIAVVTWESGEDGIDRDIYMIDMSATEDVKNENHT